MIGQVCINGTVGRCNNGSAHFSKCTFVHRIYPNPITVCISDVQPPVFGVPCPGGPIVAYAERDKFSALVNWTEPVAIDNSGVTPAVTSNCQSPQRFSQGTHVITYTAVDQSGNKATCSFTVKVLGNNMFGITLPCIPTSINLFFLSNGMMLALRPCQTS